MHIRFFNLPHKVSIKKNIPNKYTLKNLKNPKNYTNIIYSRIIIIIKIYKIQFHNILIITKKANITVQILKTNDNIQRRERGINFFAICSWNA